MMKMERFKNPWFWVGLGGLFFTTTGIDPSNMTSWQVLSDKLMMVLMNPFLFVSFLLAAMGQFINPTTPGIRD